MRHKRHNKRQQTLKAKLNRFVLSCLLKSAESVTVHRSADGMFHADGPAWVARLMRNRSNKSDTDEDRRPRRRRPQWTGPHHVRHVARALPTEDWMHETAQHELDDCEMIRPPPLMWPGDGSYPSDGGVVSVGVHVTCNWSLGGASWADVTNHEEHCIQI